MSWRAVLAEIEKEAGERSLPIIGPQKGRVLDSAVEQAKPKLALEIGALVGYSAIRIARLLPKGGKLKSVEIDRARANIASQNVKRAGLGDRVEFITGDAKKVLAELQGPFDLVFIDAEKSEYRTYLRLVEDKLHKGSIIVADNAGIFAHAMRDYLEHVRSSGLYESRYHGDLDSYGDGVEVSVRL